MTPDCSFLAFGTLGYHVYVYKHNGIQFDTSPQIISYATNSYRVVSITNDHQYLTVSDWTSDKVYRYFFNSTKKEF